MGWPAGQGPHRPKRAGEQARVSPTSRSDKSRASSSMGNIAAEVGTGVDLPSPREAPTTPVRRLSRRRYLLLVVTVVIAYVVLEVSGVTRAIVTTIGLHPVVWVLAVVFALLATYSTWLSILPDDRVPVWARSAWAARTHPRRTAFAIIWIVLTATIIAFGLIR